MLLGNLSLIPFIFIFLIFKTKGLGILMILFIIVTLFTVGFGYLTYLMKKQSKEDYQKIINGKFKIVEDKIYDKYKSITRKNDGHKTYDYYVFTKIHGKISVESLIYNDSKKDDSIYLIFLDNNEKITNYDYHSDKVVQSKGIQKKYLASIYEIDEELKKYFITYDESLGERNFNNRINDMINEKKEKK